MAENLQKYKAAESPGLGFKSQPGRIIAFCRVGFDKREADIDANISCLASSFKSQPGRFVIIFKYGI